MNYELLEKELKNRINYPYSWGKKQTDILDQQTKFIYKATSFKKLLAHIKTACANYSNCNELKNYALNRWFNFWSAKAVESLFCEHKIVQTHPNKYDKYVDFYINNIPFDHKTTVFPKNYHHSVPYAIEHKKELIEWLYKNQSKQQRQHFKNRIFIVLVNNFNNSEHWKLKSEIIWLNQIISAYLCNFSSSKLHRFSFKNEEILADVIWAIK